MVKLQKDEVVEDVTWAEAVSVEKKTDIQNAFNLLDLRVKRGLSKEKLAVVYEAYLKMHPEVALHSVPLSEIELLHTLIHGEQHQYVECPATDEPLFIQRLFLVVTYEDGDTWHLYMYDSVRDILKKGLENIEEDFPEYREVCEIFEQFYEIAKTAEEMVDGLDPDCLSQAEKKNLYNRLTALKTELDNLTARLKKMDKTLEERLFFDIEPFICEMEEMSMNLLVGIMAFSDISLPEN